MMLQFKTKCKHQYKLTSTSLPQLTRNKMRRCFNLDVAMIRFLILYSIFTPTLGWKYFLDP